MRNMGEIYVEESGNYQIDLLRSDWSLQLQPHYRNANIELADVDYIFQYHNRVILLEYKNAKLPSEQGFRTADQFNPNSDKKIHNIAQKFFDSYFYISAKRYKRPVTYIYVLEWPHGDVTMRKALRNKIAAKLPFRFQQEEHIGQHIIDEFAVLSIEEWNQRYRELPITRV